MRVSYPRPAQPTVPASPPRDRASIVSDLFPKSVVATLTGLAGMVGGLGSFLFNQCSGILFTYSRESNMSFFGFEGIQAGYMIVFLVASVAYILSWFAVKSLTSDVKK